MIYWLTMTEYSLSPDGGRICFLEVLPYNRRITGYFNVENSGVSLIYKSMACVADRSEKAQQAYAVLHAKYSFVEKHQADVLIALGGDGFMLHTLHENMGLQIPIYGMNCGTVGFLMNSYRDDDLLACINQTKLVMLRPLCMNAVGADGQEYSALAINEVSLLRRNSQAARLCIKIDGKVRLPELICDGVLLATPAGSTAYNLSVNGPILPIGSDILALTPISPFRPRRWNGAILPAMAYVEIAVIAWEKRPVNVVADFTEIKNVISVTIKEDPSHAIQLLFDPGHSLEERIVREQFVS